MYGFGFRGRVPPYYIILAVVPRRRRRRGSTTRSQTARRTHAACGTRGRCTPAGAVRLQIPPQLLATPTSSTPACWRSGAATTDSSTTAPGCRRGARRALQRARPRRREHFGPRRCSPRSPACPTSSPSLCANQPVSRRRVDGVEDDAAIQDDRAVCRVFLPIAKVESNRCAVIDAHWSHVFVEIF